MAGFRPAFQERIFSASPHRGYAHPASPKWRLLEWRKLVLQGARAFAPNASESHDRGTNDLLASDVARTNQIHAWFVTKHPVEARLVKT
jgi:starvation-inducible DNA-binding protein